MFAISAAITALAGALNVALVLYVSPELSSWFLSGDFLVMVIFGGIGTLAGPVFGAAAMIGLEEILSVATERWPFFLGLAIILRVLLWPELKRIAAIRKA